jgi:hypothetical protein
MSVTFDEFGVPQTVNGKAVKGSSKRGWKKAVKTSFFQLFEDKPYPYIATNPFSGVTVELAPLEYTIYAWCTAWYIRYSDDCPTEVTVQTYDDMKYFLLEINSEAYMDLID